MTKSEFLRRLEKALAPLGAQERQAALEYWEEYIAEAAAQSSEEEAIMKIDAPEDIAQRLLAEAGITPPVCYAYPYGAYSAETEEILKEMGFRCTLSCEERQNKIVRGNPNCLYLLGRYNRPSGVSTTTFFERVFSKEGTT